MKKKRKEKKCKTRSHANGQENKIIEFYDRCPFYTRVPKPQYLCADSDGDMAVPLRQTVIDLTASNKEGRHRYRNDR